jgi:hypothetical protein
MHGQPGEKPHLSSISYPLFSKAISFADKEQLVKWAKDSPDGEEKDVLTYFMHVFFLRAAFHEKQSDWLDPKQAAAMAEWCIEQGADPFRYVSIEPDLSDPHSHTLPVPLLFRAIKKPCFDVIIKTYADPAQALNTPIGHGAQQQTLSVRFSNWRNLDVDVVKIMIDLGLKDVSDLIEGFAKIGKWASVEALLNHLGELNHWIPKS